MNERELAERILSDDGLMIPKQPRAEMFIREDRARTLQEAIERLEGDDWRERSGRNENERAIYVLKIMLKEMGHE